MDELINFAMEHEKLIIVVCSLLTAIIGLITKSLFSSKKLKQKQKSGKNGTSIQVGGDLNIGTFNSRTNTDKSVCNQKQNLGDESIGIQAGGNVNLESLEWVNKNKK